jgi:hypothetical protein
MEAKASLLPTAGEQKTAFFAFTAAITRSLCVLVGDVELSGYASARLLGHIDRSVKVGTWHLCYCPGVEVIHSSETENSYVRSVGDIEPALVFT